MLDGAGEANNRFVAEGPSPSATFFASLFSFTPNYSNLRLYTFGRSSSVLLWRLTLATMDSSVFYPKPNIDIMTTER